MSKFTFWADLFKFSDGVLDEDYPFDKNYSLKLKGKSNDGLVETSLKFEQSKPDATMQSKNAVELKQKVVFNSYEVESKVKSGGKMTSEVLVKLASIDDTFKGWSYILTPTLIVGGTLDKASTITGLKYSQENLEAKATIDAPGLNNVTVEAAVKPDKDSELIVGGTADFTVKDTTLKSYEAGLLYKLDDKFSYGIKNWSTDGKDFGNFSINTLHSVNKATDVASKVCYSLSEKALDATAGFTHSFNDDWTWKAKVNSAGQFATSSKHKISKSTFVTISSALDIGSKALSYGNPHPFGIALESKF